MNAYQIIAVCTLVLVIFILMIVTGVVVV